MKSLKDYDKAWELLERLWKLEETDLLDTADRMWVRQAKDKLYLQISQFNWNKSKISVTTHAYEESGS